MLTASHALPTAMLRCDVVCVCAREMGRKQTSSARSEAVQLMRCTASLPVQYYWSAFCPFPLHCQSVGALTVTGGAREIGRKETLNALGESSPYLCKFSIWSTHPM